MIRQSGATRAATTLVGAMAASTSALALLCVPTAAQAQVQASQLEEVVVTAQRREQRLQEVPVAITAISHDAIAANHINNIRDLSALAPSLLVRTQPGGSQLPSYTMRGYNNTGAVPGVDRGVGLYVDGVYLAGGSGAIFELADIERIEVLRGPQGTLFGRNSTAGAIQLITREPNGRFGVSAAGTLGNYDQRRVRLRVSTPEVGAFSATAAYMHSERRGDLRNLGGGTVWDFSPAFGRTVKLTSPNYLGSHDVDAWTAAIKFEPSDSFKAVYRYDHSTDTYTSDGFGVVYVQPRLALLLAGQPNPLTPITRTRPKAVNNWDSVNSDTLSWGHNLTATWRAADNLTFKNIFAVRKLGFHGPFTNIEGMGGLTNLGTAPFANFLGAALTASTIGAPLLIQTVTTNGADDQWSNELQANYESKLVTLTAGGMWYKGVSKKWYTGEDVGLGRARGGAFRVHPGFVVPFAGQPTGGGGRLTKVTSKSVGAYAQAEVHVTPQLDLVAGGRYTEDKKHGFDFSTFTLATPAGTQPNPIDYKGHKFTYNLGANYKLSSEQMLYAKYSTGYISGGSLGPFTFNPETAKSLEAGLKADWLDRTLRTNLAVYQVKYGQLQATSSGTLLTPARPDLTSVVINAGDAKATGVEVETTYAVTRNLVLTANLAYLDFEFTNLNPVVTAGNVEYRPIFRPKWTANVAAQYTSDPVFHDAKVQARIDGIYRSRQNGVPGIPNINTAPVLAGSTVQSFSAADQAAFRQASIIRPYWIWNGRIGIQDLQINGGRAQISLWSRNLFNNKSIAYLQSLVTVISADYERARTVGVDVSVEF